MALHCQGPTFSYTAFYEAYPHGVVAIHSIHVYPHEQLRMTVSAIGSHHYQLTLSSPTNSTLFAHTVIVPTALANSAECVAENPTGGPQPFTASVHFSSCQVDHTSIGGVAPPDSTQPLYPLTPTPLPLTNKQAIPLDTVGALSAAGGFTLAPLSISSHSPD